MKRHILASTADRRRPITEFTEAEIASLPDAFLCVTRIPGGLHGNKFGVVRKSEMINDPNKCMIIDSYWGYAHGRDVYIARGSDLTEYKKEKIDAIEREVSKLRKSLVHW